MSANDFTHLHLHTQYSFLDGAIRIKDLVKRTAELGMKQVAVTDHGNMFGALDFYTQAKAAGIKPIMGMEAYVTGQSRHTDKVRENFHLVLLAENDIGYDNLRKLSSKGFLSGKFYYPRVDKQLLHEYREGIIALTACLGGEVGKKCAKGDIDGARAAVKEFKNIFGPEHFFLEVQPNGIPVQNKVNADLAQLAKDEGLRLIATNDCHYVTRDQHDAQNILMAIRQQKAWNDPTLHKHETDAFYIRSGQEMWDLLRSDYASAFELACEVGARCNVKLDTGHTYMPPFPFPQEYKDEEDYLRHLTSKGLERRFKEMPYSVDRDAYQARLQLELSVIIRMGFSGYFLIVQDFINWAKDTDIRVGPGRGSGAGSLVAYALRITDLDPIPYNLLFERFLNPDRVSMPDFDVDFMQERRHEVIEYVTNKYGRARVGQIATYSALNPKSAIKDVARTLGVPFAEINELTKPMPLLVDGKKPDLEHALEYAPKLKDKAKTDPVYKRVLETARVIEGLYRQAGMHAAGIVIGEKDLVEYVPVFAGQNGELVTQFDKDKVEIAGLVKFDFLGLKTLDVISTAEKLVNLRIKRENLLSPELRALAAKKHPHCGHPGRSDRDPSQDDAGGLDSRNESRNDHILPLVVELLPPDEPGVYQLIASGDTLGVFQVESQGFQDLCRRLKPDCFEDIIAAGALYRPGPMQSGMVDDFVDRKHGRKRVEYPHPSLEPILKPTYGTFVYQEQVLLSAQVLAGYSLGNADLLRRAMGKKKLDEMQQQRAQFIAGAEKNGVLSEQAGHIFDSIEKFAGYGFNKSHSASYALITYQTAYLKRFYPIEFMAALLSTSSGVTTDVVKYVAEARSSGIDVLAPDINQSQRGFTVDYVAPAAEPKSKKETAYGKIRFGFEAIKGLGEAALDTILEARENIGEFKSVDHLCEQVPSGKLNKRVFEALVKSGALDVFGKTRRHLFSGIEATLARAQKSQKEAQSGQFSLFGGLVAEPEPVSKVEAFVEPEWSEKERLVYERESLGIYLSGHPLDRFAAEVKKLGAIPTTQLTTVRHNESVHVAGVVSELRERPLKSGDGRWAVVVLEDNFGHAEVLCFNKAYEQAEEILKSGEPILVSGRALIDDVDDEGRQPAPKMRLESVSLLSSAQMERTRFLDIEVHFNILWSDQECVSVLENIRQTCSKHPGTKPLRLKILHKDDFQALLVSGSDLSVAPSEQLLHELGGLRGIVKAVRT